MSPRSIFYMVLVVSVAAVASIAIDFYLNAPPVKPPTAAGIATVPVEPINPGLIPGIKPPAEPSPTIYNLDTLPSDALGGRLILLGEKMDNNSETAAALSPIIEKIIETNNDILRTVNLNEKSISDMYLDELRRPASYQFALDTALNQFAGFTWRRDTKFAFTKINDESYAISLDRVNGDLPMMVQSFRVSSGSTALRKLIQRFPEILITQLPANVRLVSESKWMKHAELDTGRDFPLEGVRYFLWFDE